MKVTPQQRTREQMAWEEVGHTDIRPAAAWALALFFLTVVYVVPIHQHAREWREGVSMQSLDLARRLPEVFAPIREQGVRLSSIIDANRIFLRHINEYEDNLEDASLAGQIIRPTVQSLMASRLGVGNEQAYVGREGWLFYRPGIDYLTGPGFLDPKQLARRAALGSEWIAAPQPDPRQAILDFKRQLDERGIHLIVMPTPIKPTVHPERFSALYDPRTAPLQNASYHQLITELRDAGITVFDPADLMIKRKAENGSSQYLATDTHWRPEAMDAVAQELAVFIQDGRATPPAEPPLRRNPVRLAAPGDIALMLDLPKEQEVFPPESVAIQQVLTDDGQFWRSSEDAEVLVLGDSFSNIYSLEPMGWGESAGFVEQLSYHLDSPVDRLIRNDSGAFATRDMLSRELARGRDRLAGKKIVIWQFAARELAVGDWRIIPLELRDPPETRFIVPEPGDSILVTGIVREVSPVPRPGTVPYRDHVVSIHLTDLPDDGEAVVYMMSMIDNQWTRAARLRPGEEITLRLRAWPDVAHQYEALNRSDLDDLDLQLQEPCWGEWK